MIKLIPLTHLDREELITNLRAGKTYTRSNSLDATYDVLHYDKSHIRSPFRYGLKPWDWRGITELKEITEYHWYDNIPEEGVLCWVSNNDTRTRLKALVIMEHEPIAESPFYAATGLGRWDFAAPVQPTDLYQEPV